MTGWGPVCHTYSATTLLGFNIGFVNVPTVQPFLYNLYLFLYTVGFGQHLFIPFLCFLYSVSVFLEWDLLVFGRLEVRGVTGWGPVCHTYSATTLFGFYISFVNIHTVFVLFFVFYYLYLFLSIYVVSVFYVVLAPHLSCIYVNIVNILSIFIKHFYKVILMGW